MDKANLARWGMLAGALAALVAVSLLSRNNGRAVKAEVAGATRAIARPPGTPVIAAAVHIPDAASAGQERNDPFAPRGWQAAPLAAKAAPVVPPPPEPAPAPSSAAPSVPPPVPYAFMGQMDDAGRTVVYLSRGDQTLLARPGETLENVYKVLAIDARQIEFEHLPTGARQVLSMPASQ